MTGTPFRCAASTMEAAISPLCGATRRTSTPLVSMLSACLVCTASSPFATCTSSTAPTSLARCSPCCLSRCQRASLSVSIEKPMRTGPAGRAVAVAEVSCGALTHAASRNATAMTLRMRALLYHERRRADDRARSHEARDAKRLHDVLNRRGLADALQRPGLLRRQQLLELPVRLRAHVADPGGECAHLQDEASGARGVGVGRAEELVERALMPLQLLGERTERGVARLNHHQQRLDLRGVQLEHGRDRGEGRRQLRLLGLNRKRMGEKDQTCGGNRFLHGHSSRPRTIDMTCHMSAPPGRRMPVTRGTERSWSGSFRPFTRPASPGPWPAAIATAATRRTCCRRCT